MKIVLTKLWVHNAADYSDLVVLPQKPGATVGFSAEVSRRARADGSWQTVRGPGTDQTLPIITSMVDRATADWLARMVGRRVMLRDSRGRIVWGVFGDLKLLEARARNAVESLSFTLAPSGPQSPEV